MGKKAELNKITKEIEKCGCGTGAMMRSILIRSESKKAGRRDYDTRQGAGSSAKHIGTGLFLRIRNFFSGADR